jgi:hypothetical protein
MTWQLVRKELRENALWALIAFVVAMGVVFFRRAPDLLGPMAGHLGYQYSYFQSIGLFQGESTVGLPLLWGTRLMAQFCVVWGAALGFAQTLPDRFRRTDEVLLALPVRRTGVLMAKVGAGVLLYLLSVGVPYGLLVLRAAAPGHYPSPFRCWMTAPGLAAMACGLSAYGAAVFAATRRGRWYLHGALPLVAAAGAAYFYTFDALLWGGSGVLLAIVFVWAAAAERRRARFRLPVVASDLAAWLATGLLALFLLSPAFPEPELCIARVTPEGELGFARYNRPTGRWELYDRDFALRGEWIPGPAGFSLESADLRPQDMAPRWWHLWKWRFPWSYADRPCVIEDERPGRTLLWYWLPEERVFEAYDVATRLPAGQVGRKGLEPEGRASAFERLPIPVPSHRWHLIQTTHLVLPTRDGAYLLHLSEDKVAELSGLEGKGAINAAITPTIMVERGEYGMQADATLYVQTREAIHAYDIGARHLARLPLAPAERKAEMLRIARLPDDRYLILSVPAGRRWLYLDGMSARWLEAAGQTLNSAKVNAPVRFAPEPSPVCGVPVGILRPLGACLWARFEQARPHAVTLREVRIRNGFLRWWYPSDAALWTAAVMGLLCGVVVAWHARRALMGRWATAGWCLVALAAGPAGLLTYLTTAARPEREKCTACGRPKRLAAEVCPHCGAPVPEPPPRGTELFA